MIKKRLKQVGLLLVVLFVIAQFFGPEKNEGALASVNPFLTETKATPKVASTLKMVCFDCHSNHTRYPWYSNITPVNYWMADHVKHGKKHFNASDWQKYSKAKKQHKIDEIIEEVESKHMPLPSYTWAHSKAKLSNEEIQQLINWAKQAKINY